MFKIQHISAVCLVAIVLSGCGYTQSNTDTSEPAQSNTDTETYPFQFWSLIASNEPADYLGNIIGYESLSDWKEYKPLTVQVEELTKGLNSDSEKALAIAKWVKTSKEYETNPSAVSVANQHGSIIKIFEAPKGVCLDAAYLTAAMMRKAGIPARAVSPAKGIMHEYTEIFVNGEWKSLDTTFGTGRPQFLTEGRYARDQLRFLHEYGGYDKNDNTFVLLVKSVSKDGYGTVKYPAISEQRLDNWYKTWSKGAANPDFYCALRYKQNNNWEPMGTADFQKMGRYFIDENYRDVNIPFESTDGWIIEALPPGEYKFDCSIANVLDQNPPYQTAYAEFFINPNTQTTITADMFQKIPGAPEKDFQSIIKLLEDSKRE